MSALYNIPVYRYDDATSSAASGSVPVVLIHAFPVDHHVWDACASKLVEKLRSCGLHMPVLAVDMPGAGINPAPAVEIAHTVEEVRAEDGAFPQAINTLASSIVHAIEREGYRQAIWAGISMGGYVTLAIQRLHPERVAGIALCNTKADADTAEQRSKRLAAADMMESRSTLEPVLHFAQPKDSDSAFKQSAQFVETFTAWINAQNPAGVAWRQRMAAGRPDENQTLATITAPVAVVSADRDDSSYPDIMRPMIGAIGHEDVTFSVIEDCGHFSCFEKPDEVANALCDLAQRVSARLGSADFDSPESSSSARDFGALLNYDLMNAAYAAHDADALRDVPLASGKIDANASVRQGLDRDGWRGWRDILSDESTSIILVNRDRVAIVRDGVSPTITTGHKRRLAQLPANYLAAAIGENYDCLLYLGQANDMTPGVVSVNSAQQHRTRTFVAVMCDVWHAGSARNAQGDVQADALLRSMMTKFDWRTVREAGPVLSAHDAQLMTIAVSLAQWRAGQRFCAVCGKIVRPIHGGWAVQCADGHAGHGDRADSVTFARINPAMIALITDEHNRIVLQHDMNWEEGLYSLPSGFVDAAETAEQCVVRELREELGLGVSVRSIRYLASQPWPFPGSLMLAFSVKTHSSQLHIDTSEVADAQWFTHDELIEAVLAGRITLPSKVSIARRLIEYWYGAPIDL